MHVGRSGACISSRDAQAVGRFCLIAGCIGEPGPRSAS
jgi:hypothetical protein